MTIPSCPQQLASTDLFSISMDFLTLEFHANRIVQYVISCVWFLLLAIVFSRFIHVVANTGVEDFVYKYVFNILGYMLRNEIAKVHESSV
jgi:hypothetical protein